MIQIPEDNIFIYFNDNKDSLLVHDLIIENEYPSEYQYDFEGVPVAKFKLGKNIETRVPLFDYMIVKEGDFTGIVLKTHKELEERVMRAAKLV